VLALDWRIAPAGTRYRAGAGVSTILADIDFETFSPAGYVWTPPDEPGEWRWVEPTKRKAGGWLFSKNFGRWVTLPGTSKQNAGLNAVGTRNYVQHPGFLILSLAWNLKDGKGERWWRPMDSTTLEDLSPTARHGTYTEPWAPGELCDHIAANKLIEAWGAMFEYQVWNFYCVPVLRWPALRMEQMRCAQAKSRMSSYPGKLEDAGRVLRLSQQKDKRGHDLIRKLTKPKQPSKGNEELRWTPLTAAEDFKIFYEYNRQDIRTEAEASVRLPDLNERELQNWLFDFRCNMRGMRINRAAVDDCIAIIEQAALKYDARLRDITNGRVQRHTEVAKILDWLHSQGIHLDDLDEDAVTEALTRQYPAGVLEVLRIRQTMAYGSVRKYYGLRAQTAADSRLYEQYSFASAHTKLWNSKGVQVMNLYKGIFSKPAEAQHALDIIRTRSLELLEYEYGPLGSWAAAGNKPADAMEVIASCLRSMICAGPGNKLISSDFTAIQAVGTAAMANETWRLDVFRTHGKIYEMQAAKLTGKTLQFYLDYRKEHKRHHEDRQRYGKLPILSGDFGAWIGGWRKLDKEGVLPEDDEELKQLIIQLRTSIPNTVMGWGGQTWNRFKHDEYPHKFGLEGAIVSAILEPGKCFNSRPGSHLGVSYEVFEDVLYCRPPSGGFMMYHTPRLYPSQRPGARPWEYEITYEGWNTNQTKAKAGWRVMDLYGGVAWQNVISHMCREIQADALVALDTRGYPIVMHTHDEQLAEVPDRPEYNAEAFTAIVRESLAPWAKCLDGTPWPVKVPLAWEAPFYGKWED